MKRINSILLKSILFALVISFILPGTVWAAIPEKAETKESAYLAGYSAYVYPAGSGKIQVYYDVTGTHIMEDIGSLSIKIYESTDNSSWTWVKSYTNKDTATMLGHNTRYYDSYVEYQGVAGRYYKADVCVWAGKNGDGDTRYFWTDSRRAK